MDRLCAFGWNGFFSSQIAEGIEAGLEPARVIAVDRGRLRVAAADRDADATVAGRLLQAGGSLPTVGDWVLVRRIGGVVEHVLDRRSTLARAAAGERTAQHVLAANVDMVLVVMGLDHDFNLRRLERYLAAAWQAGAQPAVVLSKADIVADPAESVREVAAVSPGAEVVATAAFTGVGVETVRSWLAQGRTGVFVGSSGAGKSTLVNVLLGHEVQATAAVRRHDQRGRHTTTVRTLFSLAGGGMIIDGPGMRELELWGAEEGLDQAFDDIATLAAGCRFRDCRHQDEPGCAVQLAVAEQRLAADRLEGYRKLVRELAYQRRRVDVAARLEENRRWKLIHREQRRLSHSAKNGGR